MATSEWINLRVLDEISPYEVYDGRIVSLTRQAVVRECELLENEPRKSPSRVTRLIGPLAAIFIASTGFSFSGCSRESEQITSVIATETPEPTKEIFCGLKPTETQFPVTTLIPTLEPTLVPTETPTPTILSTPRPTLEPTLVPTRTPTPEPIPTKIEFDEELEPRCDHPDCKKEFAYHTCLHNTFFDEETHCAYLEYSGYYSVTKDGDFDCEPTYAVFYQKWPESCGGCCFDEFESTPTRADSCEECCQAFGYDRGQCGPEYCDMTGYPSETRVKECQHTCDVNCCCYNINSESTSTPTPAN